MGSTSASPMTDSSSARYHGSHPAAIILGPAMPTNRASGTRAFNASMRPAPSVSPDASPAASATVSGRVHGISGRARACHRAAMRGTARPRLIGHELLEHGDRLVELQRLAEHDAIGLADVADLRRREAADASDPRRSRPRGSAGRPETVT
jgi:hypothetical protein